MSGSFCHRCYERMMVRLRAENGNDPTISIDRKGASFSCKIPVYDSDEMGRPIVRIWDCENNITLTYSNTEWERKKRDGEV